MVLLPNLIRIIIIIPYRTSISPMSFLLAKPTHRVFISTLVFMLIPTVLASRIFLIVWSVPLAIRVLVVSTLVLVVASSMVVIVVLMLILGSRSRILGLSLL